MDTTTKLSFRIQYTKLLHLYPSLFTFEERKELRSIIKRYYALYPPEGEAPGRSISDKIQIVQIVLEEIGLGKSAVLSVLFHELVKNKQLSIAEIETKFATQVSSIILG